MKQVKMVQYLLVLQTALYSFDNTIVPAVNEHEGEMGNKRKKKSTNGKYIDYTLITNLMH
jgi:hypothetical protein